MALINWDKPYPYKENGIQKWRREWCIPIDKLGEFFSFWNNNKFKMLSDGYSVYKSPVTNKWYLYETREASNLFIDTKSSNNTNTKLSSEDNHPPKPSIILPPYTLSDKTILRPWQIDAAEKLVSSINYWGSAIDGSELGLGKSFTACGVVRELNVPFVIVCPKAVMHQWNKVITNNFKLNKNLKGIINYELLIRGRKDCSIASFILDRKTNRKKFTWKIPDNSVIIWDEAHRLKNYQTKASKCCLEAYKQKYKQLFLSATLATSPLDLRTIGICTKLFKGGPDYYEWAYSHGVYKGTWGLVFNNSPNVLKKLHTYLFEERGVRLLRDLIPNFPESEIIVNAYDISEQETSEIRKIYDEMKKELALIKTKEKTDESEMAIRTRALQKTEILKIPLFEEMIREGLDAGMSVMVFLNYSESIDALAKRLKTNCIYDGRHLKTRNKSLELFQENKERLLITNILASREGLNAQDLDGKYPRLTLLSPTYSTRYLKQALGRVHRENSKSKSIQKIIYIANTQEQNVVDKVGQNLENLTLINNGIITDDDLKIG